MSSSVNTSTAHEGRPIDSLVRDLSGNILAFVAACVVGIAIALGSLRLTLGILGLGSMIALIVGLKVRIWVLIPLTWALTGVINALPFPLSVRDLGVLLALCGLLCNSALKRVFLHSSPHFLDFLVLANFLWLLYTFYLHPVGARSFGSETFGGRTYWNFLIAGLAYWLLIRLTRCSGNHMSIRHLGTYLVAGYMVSGVINIIAYIAPELVPYIYFFYGGVDTSPYFGFHEHSQRLIGLGPLGVILLTWFCSYRRPWKLLNPVSFGFVGLGVSIACLLASGFRSGLIWIVPAFLIGSWLHGGLWKAFKVFTVGVILVSMVVLGQGRIYDLPKPAQRALSFLPGLWDETVIKDAQGSAEWRFQLWRDILRYNMIKDWVRGDGFGVTQRDFELTLGQGRLSEALTIRGSFHSGPLTSIRNTGLVGLLLFYCLMIFAAFYALKCVRLAKNTELLPVAIFLGIELIWRPLHYTLIFGSFPVQFPDTIFFIAALRLVTLALQRGQTPVVLSAKPLACGLADENRVGRSLRLASATT
ncbi:MAG: O-antigen ligase family protein [Verrucomicrobiae bacterium]|nr:O-antigen ligase family protein [Verrucomicrobiae bacterium]